MGFRFRRSVKLLPGVRLNFSTRGVSTSIGRRGATLNIGRHGTRATIGLPGTGLSYTTRLSGPASRQPPSGAEPTQQPSAGATIVGWAVMAFLLLIIGTCMFGGSTPPAPPQLAASTPAASALPTRSVAGNNVNCRASPATGMVMAKLDKGEIVSIAGQATGWSKVARPHGDCWVSNRLLAEAP